ncbi:MAG: hypothetical protein ABW024_11820 [Microbacterium sp.]
MDWTDDVAHQLEVVTGDPMADAVRGTVTIVEASAPEGRRRYQECRVVLLAEAPGVASRNLTTAVVVDQRAWPRVGAVLPAQISRTHPDAFEADWSALARRP